MMKRFLLLLLSLWIPVCASAADICACPDAQTHAARQDKLDRILYDYRTMGASIVLIRDGQIIDTFQYGRANRADGIPVTGDTLFRVASVSKMVSAIGVLQMMEAGEIRLDDDISQTLAVTVRNPAYPDVSITLRQIMTHTASLSDGYHYLQATRGDITPLETVFEGKNTARNFLREEPGTKARYSNFGGGLLGSIVEMISGCTIDEYMSWQVFSPLGISAGYHTPSIEKGAQIARVYNVESTGMTLDPMNLTDEHWDPEPEIAYVHTAGALCITAEGLAKLLIALAGDGSVDGVRLLLPETVAEMRTLQANRGSVACDSQRGLNLNIITDLLVKGRTLYGHQGKAYGMICAAYFDPTDQSGVVLLTNGCNTATRDSVARIATAVLTQAYQYIEE